MNASVVRAEEQHIGQLVRKGLRKADSVEARRAGATSDADAVADSFHLSTDRYAVLVDDECIAMFGVHPISLLAPVGMVWMLTSPEVETYWLRFSRMSKIIAEKLFRRWEYLFNWVDAEHQESIDWLKWVGFDVSDVRVPYGPQNYPFHFFEKRGSVCAS